MYDVLIIGGGVVGAAIVRELSKYKLNICLLEKETDFAMGATKANSAIVHSGYDAKPGTLKAILNCEGNMMFDELSKDLNFPFKRNGSLVLCFDKKNMDGLYKLESQAKLNSIKDVKIIDGLVARTMEPNLNENVYAVLYAPSAGIVCPYEMTIALAENAQENGAKFFTGNRVLSIKKLKNGFSVKTNVSEFESKLVINAAGVYSDEINNMISEDKFYIRPRKGEYLLFDRDVGNTVYRTIFQLPSARGKGVLLTQTVDGNLLVGPNASDTDDKEDVKTTSKGINEVIEKASLSIKNLPMSKVISSFAGLRAKSAREDFIIGQSKDVKGFINAAGIDSPGLTSSPAIAVKVRRIITGILKPDLKENFNPKRAGIPKFRDLSYEEKNKLIKEDPKFGNIICRCEMVTEGEILRAIKSDIGANTLDGIKRRTRAGMGRCQSGFCSSKILKILAKELNVDLTEVSKFGGKSNILMSKKGV